VFETMVMWTEMCITVMNARVQVLKERLYYMCDQFGLEEF